MHLLLRSRTFVIYSFYGIFLRVIKNIPLTSKILLPSFHDLDLQTALAKQSCEIKNVQSESSTNVNRVVPYLE